MIEKRYLSFCTILLYLVVIVDLVMLILLNAYELGGFTFYLIMFLLERVVQIGYMMYQQKSTLLGQIGIGEKDYVADSLKILFFINHYSHYKQDIGQLDQLKIKQDELSLKRYQMIQKKLDKPPSKKQDQQKLQKQQEKEENEYLKKLEDLQKSFQTVSIMPILIRGYFFTQISIFMTWYAMFTQYGISVGIIIGSVFQISYLVICNGEIFFRKIFFPTFMERFLLMFIVVIEIITKLCLWGLFAYYTAPDGIYIVAIIEFIIGFFTELATQCGINDTEEDIKNKQQKEKEKTSFFGSIFNPCKQMSYVIQMVLYPLLVGIQLTFCARFEDFLIERVDKVEKVLKKGNILAVYRQIEIVIFVIVGRFATTGDYEAIITEFGLQGSFYVGIIGFVILLIWNLFFGYRKILKKNEPFFIIKDQTLQKREQQDQLMQNEIQDKQKEQQKVNLVQQQEQPQEIDLQPINKTGVVNSKNQPPPVNEQEINLDDNQKQPPKKEDTLIDKAKGWWKGIIGDNGKQEQSKPINNQNDEEKNNLQQQDEKQQNQNLNKQSKKK